MESGPPENCKHSSRTRLLRNYLTVSTLRYLLSGIVKAVLLHGKIIIKIYLSENKEVTLFVQLNW